MQFCTHFCLSLPVNLVSEVASDKGIMRSPFACCQGEGLLSLHGSAAGKYSLTSDLFDTGIILITWKTSELKVSAVNYSARCK